jgi:hypothetical protein
MHTIGAVQMPTIQELRRKQEEQVDALRRLQWNKVAAPAERKELIQHEIDALENDIRNLDTMIAGLINQSKPNKGSY